jgi:hypothetical protein
MMKLSVRIAATKRMLRRLEEDRPPFNERIDSPIESQQAFALQFFEKTIDDMEKELARLLAEQEKLRQ